MNIFGTTDSEHIAALYFYHLFGSDGDWTSLCPVGDMADAMRKTISQLEEMKTAAEKSHGVKAEHNALNLLVNSGASIIALRYASPDNHEAPSLYYSTVAGADLNRKFKGHPDEGKPGAQLSEGSKEKDEHGKHVIIGSEPNTFKAEDWHLIAKDELVLVHQDLRVEKQKLAAQNAICTSDVLQPQ